MTDHKVATREEWLTARLELLKAEKDHTRRGDELAHLRQALPWVRIDKEYRFETDEGTGSLRDLFRGRSQLLIYHFMFAPGVDGWPSAGCPGCSLVVDHIGPLAHLNARDTSLALVSRAPVANLEAYKRRMGWNLPWYSSVENDFNNDFGLTTAEGETFGLSAFLRDGENIFHTYFTTDRAIEAITSNFTLLGWTVLGRQEEWEDSPAGWPQSAPYVWWRRHDEY